MRIGRSSTIALTFVSAALLFTMAAAQGSASGDTCGNPCIVVSVGGNCSEPCIMCGPNNFCINPSSSSAFGPSPDTCGKACNDRYDCSGDCNFCDASGVCCHRDVPSPNSGSNSNGPDTCGNTCTSESDCSGHCYLCGLTGECRHPDNAPELKVSGSCNGECDCPEMCGGFCGECDAFTGRCVQPGAAKSPIRPVASSKAKKAALALLANGIDASSVLTCGHECDCPEMCSGFCGECDAFTARCVQSGTAKAPIKKLHKKQGKKLRP